MLDILLILKNQIVMMKVLSTMTSNRELIKQLYEQIEAAEAIILSKWEK